MMDEPHPEQPAPDIYAPSIDISPPSERSLKAYAFDPTLGRGLGNVMQVQVRYEPLKPGPIGSRFAVVDYDGALKTWYAPVDLDDPMLLARGGLDPTESDPRFHQQMVYAVASETLERFEAALGRRIHWRRAPKKKVANLLYLHPHAMQQANAFYSPEAHGILFGYFRAGQGPLGLNLPGQTVFTCLSHDIIAHEVTHAIVDGIRQHFTEPSNIDVPAFHEAFADLAALFRHFSHAEALHDTLQRTGGRLYTSQLRTDAAAKGDPTIQAEVEADNPLIELARQFGQVSGLRGGLRGALGSKPNSRDIELKTEPHARGAILVAAVFDAYFTIYLRRTRDLFRIFRAGGGPADPVDLPGPLADQLAAQASRTAEMFFAICARALDYCPPVDISFGDFLRAMITADFDLYPVDSDGVRDALMQAFRLRGIIPEGVSYFSEDALCWPKVQPPSAERPETLPPVTGLVFGDPNGLLTTEKNINGDVLRAYAAANAEKLGFDPADGSIQVPSFHPMFRRAEDGSLKIDMVVELVQTRAVAFDPDDRTRGQFQMHGGATLIIAQQPLTAGARPDPVVRYAIARHMGEAGRTERQRAAFTVFGMTDCDSCKIDFSLIHGA